MWENDEGGAECIRRGQSIIEFYENTVNATEVVFLFQTRGSSCLIYNNYLTTDTVSPLIKFWEEEYGSNFSGIRTVWPAEDTIHNTFVWGNTFGGNPYFNQASHFNVVPGNDDCTGSGTPFAGCTGSGTGTCDFDEANALIKLNRDVFLHEPATTGSEETLGCEYFYEASDCAAEHDPVYACTGSGTGTLYPVSYTHLTLPTN